MKLPSNKKFGYFFSLVFLIVSTYFYYNETLIISYVFIILTAIFFIITIINADLFLPLNKIWMRFGFLLGKIISPIILGFIFFGLITPYGVIMRIFGRDELNLKKIKSKKSKSYWIDRPNVSSQINFKKQF